MKKRNLFSAILMGAALAFFSSCGEENNDPTPSSNTWSFENLPNDTGSKPTTAQMDEAVANFVDEVAIPTYARLETRMAALKASVDKFQSSGSQNDLDDACDAWKAAREPWEQSEAFLYGPAALKKLDPSLDSWPLDKNGIEQIIATGNWDKIDGEVNDEDDAPVDAPQNLRGFHTAEKLLFDNGQNRSATDFQANEKVYLQKVIERMLADVKSLHQGWKDGLGAADKDVPTSYGNAMKIHDGKNYTLSSVYHSIEMILNNESGMAGISNEVGTAKIKDPVDLWNKGDQEGAVLSVESWYSWNSLIDFEDNIESIKNCYFGGIDGQYNKDKSLSALVKTINPTLDSLMTVQIDATIRAIRGIPTPFRNNLGAATEIKEATDACAALTKGLGIVRSKLSADY